MSTFDSRTGKLKPQSILQQHYLILRVAGRGGMSAIYLALDTRMSQRRVAIKEMSQENLDLTERREAVALFQQEAQLLARLNHPNLPHIYDYFGTGDRSYLVMDYVDGKTLLQLLQTAGKALPVEQVLGYAEQLCDVLMYLHQQNPPVIFRDLKPSNVMATQEGRIYLVDFGIARLFKEGQSHDTVVLGSPGYAPPEQHGTGQTNPRSDLYALGATLHCCLSNRDPYHSEERFVFEPVRNFNSQVPPELDQLIMRLLSLDENQRPASAFEVKQTLIRIRQQGRGAMSSPRMPAMQIPDPDPAQSVYQPTQPALPPIEPQGRLILGSTPTPGAKQPPTNQRYPVQPYAAPPPNGPWQVPQAWPDLTRTRVWTPGFIIVFLLFLALTITGSTLAFNVVHPYTNNPVAGLDHATEAALAALVLILAFTFIILTRSFMAVLVILLSVLAVLTTLAIFLLQTLRDVEPSAQLFTQFGPAEINQTITYGLLAAAGISLLWLFRIPFTWGDRFWLLLFFGAAGACAYLQQSYPDVSLNNGALYKHLLLLSTLIIFIQGLLMAGQMERKRKRR
jgi:serine/threonine protein kinase